MTLCAHRFWSALLLLAGLALCGCLPSAPRDEEKEPYYLAGKSRVNTRDFKGAVESFEKAVEVNPKSAPAHFELGWLYDEKESDAAAAIYHYRRFLKLAPNSGKEQMVTNRILACKQQLAQTVSLGNLSERQQRDLDQLLEENKRLREETEKWRLYTARLQSATNQSPAGFQAPRPAQPSGAAQTPAVNLSTSNAASPPRSTVAPASASSRTHIVRAGETPIMIARKYGIRPEVLLAANPRVDPRRLRVGQALTIPAP